VGERLCRFAEELGTRFGSIAEVDRSDGLSVSLTPGDGGLAVCWFDTGSELQVETLGGPGGRWELARTEVDAEFLEDVVRSVVAGRVEEVFGGSGRSRVLVTLTDGSTATETGYTGLRSLLPRPGWPRRGRRVKYGAYSG
jgi:hypothetical protein